jgi:methylated-DNA-[protein]-cysteine S-methyltransferase
VSGFSLIPSPLGEILLLADEGGVAGVHLQEGPGARELDPAWKDARDALAETGRQLGQYFAGDRSGFELALAPRGTAWQRRVWRAVSEIPYGETVGYGALARRLGRPRAARAVGAANALNPISIVIPCHRLLGSGGALTGYAGGLERKRALLGLEAGSDPRPQRTYRLLGADREPYDSALQGLLGGHRGNRVYGRLDCAGAASWIARGHYVKNRVFFSDEAIAIAAGFRPCGGCMRERYAEWKQGGSAAAGSGVG